MNERNLTSFALGVGGLALLVGLFAQAFFGLPTFFLALAAGALLITIVLMWGSIQQIGDPEKMTFEQALSFAAPSAAEEQKRALLRTLKDLEYELSVGKISREDYDQVSADIRVKAKQFIALTDVSMKDRLAAAEKRVMLRLENTQLDMLADAPTDEAPSHDEGADGSAPTESKTVSAEETTGHSNASSEINSASESTTEEASEPSNAGAQSSAKQEETK